MTVKGGTSQACAACKYQRRRCGPDCLLAPYFLPDHSKEFLNAHRLFGVSNIQKILKLLDPSQRSEAMRSIIFESNMRDRFPVHGCVAAIHTYQLQIHRAQQELDALNAHLAFHRHRHRQLDAAATAPGQVELDITAIPPDTLTLFQPHQQIPTSQDEELQLENINNCDNAKALVTVKTDQEYSGSTTILWAANSAQVQANSSHDHNQITSNGINGSLHVISNEIINENVEQGNNNDYDSISPYLENNIEDRQSYIDSKIEAYEYSSSESSLKDVKQLVELVEDNELKSAAAHFSLTSDHS